MKYSCIIVLLVLFSCNKPKDELYNLPAETQIGANTFGFRINGSIWNWNAKNFYNSGNNPDATFTNLNNGTLSLLADRVIYKGLTTTISQSIYFDFFKNLNQVGVYRLSKIDSLHNVQYVDNKLNIYFGLLANRETFEITITKLDTISKIVSGRFNGILYNNYNQSDSINISEGRFDLKLKIP